MSVTEQQGKTEKPYWYDGVHSHKLVPRSNPTTRSLTFYSLDEENERRLDRVCELKQTGVHTLLWGYTESGVSHQIETKSLFDFRPHCVKNKQTNI